MLKKILIGFIAVLGLALVAVMLDMSPNRLFGDSKPKDTERAVTDNMFVSEDTDGFSPGLPAGGRFPAIRAVYQGQEINNIDRFVEDRGAVFIAVRSTDW